MFAAKWLEILFIHMYRPCARYWAKVRGMGVNRAHFLPFGILHAVRNDWYFPKRVINAPNKACTWNTSTWCGGTLIWRRRVGTAFRKGPWRRRLPYPALPFGAIAWMCPSKSHILEPNTQCGSMVLSGGAFGGNDKVTRVLPSCSYKRGWRELPCILWERSKEAHLWSGEPALTWHWICWLLDLRLPSLRKCDQSISC